MKLAHGWIKEFLPAMPPPPEAARRLSAAGLGIASLTPFSTALSGVVVGEVVAAGPHPNADRLRLCTVDAGGERHQVVCGAPNVRAGMKAPLALPGARLPGGKTITPATIRGVQSHGMLCSAVELGLGADAAGLLELDAAAIPGEPFVPNPEDWVLDIEVTPNRGDCLSVLGVARQLGAVLGAEAKAPWPDPVAVGTGDGGWVVGIEDPEGCGLYTACLLEGVSVKPAPDWMQRRLLAAGIRPINNVVDITNYVLLELGQPLHAFDPARLRGRRIAARRARVGEVLKTLDGVDRRLTAEHLVIADENGPVALAGVMGGASSEIAASTSSVLLEAAWFDPVRVRRGARSLGLGTESSYRFERGVDPGGVERAARRAVQLLVEHAGARIASGLLTARGRLPARPVIELDPAEISARLGLAPPLPGARAAELLARLGATVEAHGGGLRVTPPSWRLDLNRPADLAEELATLVGYETVPVTLPIRDGGLPAPDPRERVSSRVRAALRAAGFSEAVTTGFMSREEAERSGAGAAAVPVKNPMTDEQAWLATWLVPGLLRSAGYNLRHGAEGACLFEIGHVYHREGGATREALHVGLVAAGAVPKAAHRAERALDVFDVKGAVEQVLAALGLAGAVVEIERAAGAGPIAAATIRVDGRTVGALWSAAGGATTAEAGVPSETAAAELALAPVTGGAAGASWTPLTELARLDATVVPPPPFPPVKRDIALVVAADVPAERLRRAILAGGKGPGSLLESAEPFDEYRGRQAGEGRKSVAFRLLFRAADRTLTDAEVDGVLRQVLERVRADTGAELRAA